MMTVLEVFYLAMCCSTGVCGPSPDPVLPAFAADLEWLSEQGVEVRRFNLSQEPGEFVQRPVVQALLTRYGEDARPIVMVGAAPFRRPVSLTRRAGRLGRDRRRVTPTSPWSDTVAELVAIGAAVGERTASHAWTITSAGRAISVSTTRSSAAPCARPAPSRTPRPGRSCATPTNCSRTPPRRRSGMAAAAPARVDVALTPTGQQASGGCCCGVVLYLLDDPGKVLFSPARAASARRRSRRPPQWPSLTAGRRVLLVSTDPASNLADVLQMATGEQPTPVPGVERLEVMNLDPQAAADDYRTRVIGPYRGVIPDSEVAALEEKLAGACTVEVAAFDTFARLLTDPKSIGATTMSCSTPPRPGTRCGC